jgi:cytoskeleton protein RodZ
MKTAPSTSDRTSSFGRRLRAARESRGRTLQQIADSTKISASVLDALERDNPSRLPAGIFMRSFIRSFAAEVGLEPEATLHDFYRAFPAFAPAQVDEDTREASGGFGGWRAVAGGVAALLFVTATAAGGYALIANPPSWLPWGVGAPPESAAPAPVLLPAAAPAPLEAPSPGAQRSRPVADAEPVRAEVTAASGVVPASAPGPDGKPPMPQSPASPQVQLVIHPRGACWVRVIALGRVRVARLMQAGERQMLDVSGPLIIEVGDAGAFDFSINGEPGRPLGPAGKVVRANLSRDNLSAFLARP